MHRQCSEGRLDGARGAEAVAGYALGTVIARASAPNIISIAALSAASFTWVDIHRIAVVTDGLHLWRADRCFRAQGFDVLACGAYYRARELEPSLLEVIPSASAAGDMKRVLHEWLGSGWYWLRGRI